jgi:predicted anti-sigma-YlaC factor YlaD
MTTIQLACAATRDRIHAALDGLLDAPGRRALDEHLAICSTCRELHGDLRGLATGLAGLPDPVLPDDALEVVWERSLARPRPRRYRGLSFAAAAVAAAAVIAIVALRPAAEPAPSPEEVAQAAAQLRFVMKITDRAIASSERSAFRELQAGIARVPVFGDALAGTKSGQRRN